MAPFNISSLTASSLPDREEDKELLHPLKEAPDREEYFSCSNFLQNEEFVFSSGLIIFWIYNWTLLEFYNGVADVDTLYNNLYYFYNYRFGTASDPSRISTSSKLHWSNFSLSLS